jgi:hypothetical protein
MKIRQVVNALPALQKLAGCELSLKVLYKIKKLLGNLEGEIAFYNEQRIKILDKYCDIVGDQYVPRDGEMEAFNAELNELFNVEIGCEVEQVTIGVGEDVKLSYNDLLMLDGFISLEELR